MSCSAPSAFTKKPGETEASPSATSALRARGFRSSAVASAVAAKGCFMKVALVLVLASTTSAAQDYDLLIRNGRVLDGTGNPDFRADIAPGFIDVHSHADRALTSNDREARKAHNLVAQGITTIGRQSWSQISIPKASSTSW